MTCAHGNETALVNVGSNSQEKTNELMTSTGSKISECHLSHQTEQQQQQYQEDNEHRKTIRNKLEPKEDAVHANEETELLVCDINQALLWLKTIGCLMTLLATV